MDKKTAKLIEQLAGDIAVRQLEAILEDLKDSELRGPQLYNAITAVLKLHKVEMDPLLVTQTVQSSGALKFGMPPTVDEGNPLYN